MSQRHFPAAGIRKIIELTPMRAALGVDAVIIQPQPLHWPASDQVLAHNLLSVRRLYMPVPDSFGVDHNRWAMFALVQTSGFIDAHRRTQSGSFCKLLQLR